MYRVPDLLKMPPKKQTSVNNFNLHINPYDGDPTTFKFFSEQINDIIRVNNWPKDVAVVFLKSKLTGSALKYYVDSPELEKINDHTELLRELKDFFCPVNSNNLAQNLHSFTMLPSESIKNLAHRLNVLVAQAYPNIKDTQAINDIKFNKFLVCVPSDIRVKILENDIKDYETAVFKAQKLQEISIQDSVINAINAPSSPGLKSEINSLKLAVENLSKNPVQNSYVQPTPNSPPPKRFRRQDKYCPKPYRNNRHFRPVYKSVKCSFCGRFDHTTQRCYFKNRSAPHQRFYRHHPN